MPSSAHGPFFPCFTPDIFQKAMPLNEAGASPSNLTKKQRHEALAAIYGIPDQLTDFDAERIRRQLATLSGRDEEPSPDQ